VVEIRDEAGLRELRSEWDALLRESASATTFNTWEWTTAWWSAYGRPGELRILTALDDRGIVRGIAPLRLKTAHRYGRSVPALSFIGDGSNDSDYLDLILHPGYEEAVMAAFQRHWDVDLRAGSVLLFNEVPAASPACTRLKGMAAQERLLWSEGDVPCATVSLPSSWEEYLNTLRPRFRTMVRSVLRNLEGRPTIQFGFCQRLEDVERLLPALFDLHTRRWAEDSKPGVFGAEAKRTFYHALSPLLFERDWLRFSWLEWNGRVIACQYGFLYNGSYFHLQEGYEPASEHWRVGLGLRAWSIRKLIENGVREYDFLSGVGRHKLDWGAAVKFSKQIAVARDTVSNRIFCHGPAWETQCRESIRKYIPAKVLAMRQAHLERRNRTTPGPSRSAWALNVGATCYSRLGLPVLARPIRERYQISLPSNGSRAGLQRRTAPYGRILYYHRVNDDQDPFFPAMSTDLFRRQMRFLAKHYRVVSLGSLLEHLNSDSTETVVAVTFDDGYQDNYNNAFPILRDYGIAATIFLTTGSIDSDEPLWFERLAEAVKNTSRESIDLEIDVPRRVWMRTPGERLEANGRIFGLLRTLKDVERRRWLNRLLEELAVPLSVPVRRSMLTWDQVREMGRLGVDFGGHTVSHPFLSQLSRDAAVREICEPKRRIEEELQKQVLFFAYPNGRAEDFAPWNKELLREAGYRAAATTIWGMNNRSTDAMELRRGGPWEETEALFALKLDWYQLVNG
jgi:peptidoglycan/xylan/chitin deacetylase (PgdA/CDA1 family)/CelD/BcsL family acetyltransferase involved in cellulose biosynthesis